MKKLVALTGAGISKASGVPTFEEMGDLRDKLSRDFFQTHTSEFYGILGSMKRNINNAKPNEAHYALAKYNIPIVTMNIDGLHRAAGSSQLIEIHGNLDYVMCKSCDKTFAFEEVYDSFHCRECGRILEPNVVLYGDQIPYFHNAAELIRSADNLLIIGTSFYTSTVNELASMARRSGIRVDIINSNSEYEVPKFLNSMK